MPDSDGLPPLSAIGTVRVEVLGPPAGAAWDASVWDTDVWAGPAWQDATPESMNVQATWGADDAQGALTIPAAGSWSIVTYDPMRLLDPANTASPLQQYIKPGGGIRILYKSEVVRTGFIDEVEFDMSSKQGSIRATDGISLMVKAKLPESISQDWPYRLHARARWLLEKAGVTLITVEDDPSGTGALDPAVGTILPGGSVWQNIATAAYDALHAVWIDNDGVLRFRYFGHPHITTITLGGDKPESIPIDTLRSKLSMDGVFNHIIAYRDMPLKEPELVEAKNQASIDKYGDLALERDRPNPDASAFVSQLLKDRGASTNQYEIGTIRPQTEAQFLAILSLGMVSIVRVRASTKHGTFISQLVTVLGGAIEANTESGWSARLTTYQPYQLWGPEPRTRVRAYNTNKSAEIYTITGGASGGVATSAQGTVSTSTRTVTGDEKRNVLLDFPEIEWDGVTSLTKAVLRFYRPYHQDLAGGIDDKVYIKARRITEGWSESAVWPGPADTNAEEVPYFCDSALDVWEERDVTAIVRAWAPSTVAGGGGQPQYGIKLMSYYDTLAAGYDPQHVILSMRLSSMPAYLYVKTEE